MTPREHCVDKARTRAAWAMECYALQCDRPHATHWADNARDWWRSAFFWLAFARELDSEP